MFIFQAEDGIRDIGVTGVQTCALPILRHQVEAAGLAAHRAHQSLRRGLRRDLEGGVVAGERVLHLEIGRASGREGENISVVAVALKKIYERIYIRQVLFAWYDRTTVRN